MPESRNERRVEEIHLVCRRRLNVFNETADHFDSGWWAISERHIRPGVRFALHEVKDQPSELQGEIESLVQTRGKGENRRVMVQIRRTPIPLSWKGGGSGEVGYLWEN